MSKKINELQLSLFEDAVAVIEMPPAFIAQKTPLAQEIEVALEPKSVRDLFVLRDEYLNGVAGDRSKIEANLAAIEIVKGATATGRKLTSDEKSRVAAYSGWGGLSDVFAQNTKYPAQQARLQELLGPQAYASAMESVLSAYYTEPAVIRSIWEMVRHMGFEGGRVLEPSCGVGHFIGAMPQEMRQQSKVVMVEIDEITAAMAGGLYADDQTMVYPTGLQSAPIRPESFDLVVGNVPFGNYRVHDKRFDHLRANIHDYFFAKCLDALRPGGIMCLITSTWTMDKSESRMRKYLSERANLLTAIRLPSGAFKRLGGTDVVADIVVLQKKSFGEKPAVFFEESIPAPSILTERAQGAHCNQFFAEHPGHVLGKLTPMPGRYGTRWGVTGCEDWESALLGLCRDSALHGRFDGAQNVSEKKVVRDAKSVKVGAAFGYFFAEDGQLVMLDEHSRVQTLANLPSSTLLRIEGMTRIRDAALELLESDASQSPCAQERRAKLNALYDSFVKRFGFLMGQHNRRLFSADSHAPLLWSLESYDEEEDTAVKADIFSRPTVARAVLAETAETIAQAMALSFNRYARFDAAFVAKALGRSTDDVIEELVASDMVYLEPETLRWVDSESYLCGDVYEKLKVAQAAQAGDVRFERNVRALQAILPPVVPLSSVAVRLGVPWVSATYVEQFVCDLLGVSNERELVQITHMHSVASWSVDGWIKNHHVANKEWGTSRRKFHALLSDLLNQRSTEVHDKIDLGGGKTKLVLNSDETIAAREVAEKIQSAFERWVFADAERVEQLQDIYNRTYNGRVNRKFNGSHLVVPGLNPAITLRQAQKDAIWRGLVGGNTLFAQAVGGGKTLIQICLAHEAKRLGLANKPALVVPNHMLEAFAGEYLRAFPRAKVLAAGKEDLVGDRRRTLLMRAAMHDWDCIIITHGSFGRLGVSKDELQAFIREVAAEVEQSVTGATDNNAVRDAMRQKKQIEAKLESLGSDEGKDGGVLSFDKLGIDMLCVDEADLFKNLWFHTKKTRVAGLNNTCSARALDLLLKSRLIFRNRGFDGFGLNFATATPIANTIAEMFVMQTYLHPWTLQEKGLDSFDAWAANFAREVTAIEVKPEGSGYRMHTRLARFVNVPELMLLFREVAEIRTKKDLALPEPVLHENRHTIVSVPASEQQKAYVQGLVERAKAIRDGDVKPDEDNMLCVTNDGRKAALDMRCVCPSAADYPGSKVNACVERVYQHWLDGREGRLTQLVFSDLSVPSNADFSVYRDVREKLIARGVPDADIAFAQDFKSDKAKAELHRKVRQGVIRILIGSTELMGFGTNVQDRLVAKHDLDAPWRPRDVEQRDGRIIRQKNQNETVYIYRYVTEQTFDAYMWQTLERKAGFIAQVMEHTGEARTVEDVTSQALSFAEVKALASGNPIVIEKAGVDAQVARLVALKSVYMSDRCKDSAQIRFDQDSIAHKKRLVQSLSLDLQNIGNTNEVTISGVCIRDAAVAGKEIMKSMALAADAVKAGRRKIDLFKVGNAMLVYEDYGHKQLRVRIGGEMAYEVRLPYGAENIASALRSGVIECQLREQLDREIKRVAELEVSIRAMQERMKKPFEHERALEEALERQAEIDSHLEVDAQDKSLVSFEESSD